MRNDIALIEIAYLLDRSYQAVRARRCVLREKALEDQPWYERQRNLARTKPRAHRFGTTEQLPQPRAKSGRNLTSAERSKRYYYSHLEQRRAAVRAYQQSHREQRRAYTQSHREQHNAQMRSWRQRNRERLNAQRRAYEASCRVRSAT